MSAEDEQYNLIDEQLDIGQGIKEEDDKTTMDDTNEFHYSFGINIRR